MKPPAWPLILWECCAVSHRAFKVNKMHLIHQRACPCLLVHPSSQSWQAILLSLFFLLLWSIVLNSWHISPHTLTSKIAFCQYEGKDSFGFNGARHHMLDITGTMKNNQNVNSGPSVSDGFPPCINEGLTSLETWQQNVDSPYFKATFVLHQKVCSIFSQQRDQNDRTASDESLHHEADGV